MLSSLSERFRFANQNIFTPLRCTRCAVMLEGHDSGFNGEKANVNPQGLWEDLEVISTLSSQNTERKR